MNKYTGEERREGYCPEHHIKCAEISTLQIDQKKKVPIWVLGLFTAAFLSSLGFINKLSMDRHEVVLKSLEGHIIHSTEVLDENSKILSRASHVLQEVAFNQKMVMKQIELDFESIPEFD